MQSCANHPRQVRTRRSQRRSCGSIPAVGTGELPRILPCCPCECPYGDRLRRQIHTIHVFGGDVEAVVSICCEPETESRFCRSGFSRVFQPKTEFLQSIFRLEIKRNRNSDSCLSVVLLYPAPYPNNVSISVWKPLYYCWGTPHATRIAPRLTEQRVPATGTVPVQLTEPRVFVHPVPGYPSIVLCAGPKTQIYVDLHCSSRASRLSPLQATDREYRIPLLISALPTAPTLQSYRGSK